MPGLDPRAGGVSTGSRRWRSRRRRRRPDGQRRRRARALRRRAPDGVTRTLGPGAASPMSTMRPAPTLGSGASGARERRPGQGHGPAVLGRDLGRRHGADDRDAEARLRVPLRPPFAHRRRDDARRGQRRRSAVRRARREARRRARDEAEKVTADRRWAPRRSPLRASASSRRLLRVGRRVLEDGLRDRLARVLVDDDRLARFVSRELGGRRVAEPRRRTRLRALTRSRSRRRRTKEAARQRRHHLVGARRPTARLRARRRSCGAASGPACARSPRPARPAAAAAARASPPRSRAAAPRLGSSVSAGAPAFAAAAAGLGFAASPAAPPGPRAAAMPRAFAVDTARSSGTGVRSSARAAPRRRRLGRAAASRRPARATRRAGSICARRASGSA